jgi:hypothetical protein
MEGKLSPNLANVRKVFERLREFNVAVNPAKTKLGLAEVEFIGLANYFRDRKLIPLKKYKGSGNLMWTPETIAALE